VRPLSHAGLSSRLLVFLGRRRTLLRLVFSSKLSELRWNVLGSCCRSSPYFTIRIPLQALPRLCRLRWTSEALLQRASWRPVKLRCWPELRNRGQILKRRPERVRQAPYRTREVIVRKVSAGASIMICSACSPTSSERSSTGVSAGFRVFVSPMGSSGDPYYCGRGCHLTGKPAHSKRAVQETRGAFGFGSCIMSARW